MTLDSSFWQAMTQLVTSNPVVIDRPKGAQHPRHPDMIYPLDYGYLENTTAGDGDGIDIWIGTSNEKILTGILCTFDTFKRDAEIKLLIGCTEEDIQTIRSFHNYMHTLFIPNPIVNTK
ncbi:MAG TPA: inorganic diphosphatase [Anaerolineales bacterium]|nr:inorganic diphosphatase [Anaerolineales bacterium]